jgi:hypothetical protein
MDEEERIYRKVKSIVREDNRSTYIGEDDLVRLVQRGITVNFHLKHEKLDIINIFRAIKRTQKMIALKLGYDLEDIKVNIYRSGAEVLKDSGLRSQYASWAAGYFDGEITIVSEEDDEEEAKSLTIYLTHEIIHCAVYEIGEGRCPFWLDEGLSIYLSQELPDVYLEALRDALEKEDGVLLLKDLERPDPSILEDDGLRRLAYAESACAVECMVVNPLYGWGKVNALLRETGKRGMESALFEQCLSYDLIQSDMEKWAKKKIWESFGAGRIISFEQGEK